MPDHSSCHPCPSPGATGAFASVGKHTVGPGGPFPDLSARHRLAVDEDRLVPACRHIPALLAEPSGREGEVKVWCRYCKRWHLHGAELRHRVAHCSGDAPYREMGYVLKLRTRRW